jgi:hypothetical protein
MTARYSYTPLYGYNKGVRGLKPPARIIGWDVRDNDTPWSEPASLIVTVTARSEARAIVSRLNKQQRQLRNATSIVNAQHRRLTQLANRGVR